MKSWCGLFLNQPHTSFLTNKQEETEYVELLAAEKHQVEALKNMQHQNKSLSMLDEILEDVRKAADRLEEEMEEHAFDDNKSVSSIPEQSPLCSGCLPRESMVEFIGYFPCGLTMEIKPNAFVSQRTIWFGYTEVHYTPVVLPYVFVSAPQGLISMPRFRVQVD